MDALGDATRREIMERLRGGPRPVGELATGLPISRPAVSQHLRVLKEAGLVTERKDGTRRIYSVEQQAIADLRAYFDSFWEQALAGFRAAAESEGRRR
jgi:DNA-binding transcriptional ArsR family regulator